MGRDARSGPVGVLLVLVLMGIVALVHGSGAAPEPAAEQVSDVAATTQQTPAGAWDGEPVETDVGTRTSWHSDSDLATTAKGVLTSYRDEHQPSVLVSDGYLDLLGNSWSCVVRGDGWVDLCIVRDAGEQGSTVNVLRMEAQRWEGPDGGT